MSSDDDNTSGRKRRRLNPPEDGPFLLRPILTDVPLATEDTPDDVHITAVEHWNDHIYIGTSASEILHFVSLPADIGASSEEPAYILAARLQPSSVTVAPQDTKGVEQILLLPAAGKACVLCNGIVTFYSLPELTPAFGSTKVGNCRWIGGVDENQDVGDVKEQVIMIAVSNRIMLVRIGEEARRVKNIEFPGCLRSKRRDTIACVADSSSYSLLEVEHQQKIPLFPISSSDVSTTANPGQVETLPSASSPLPTRTTSLAHRPTSQADHRAHDRSTSLGVLPGDIARNKSPRPVSTDLSGLTASELPPTDRSRGSSPSPEKGIPDHDKALPLPPKSISLLKPHIATPTSSEFLLTTGTKHDEPGVGLFVNLDGDVVRGTIEFRSYPEAVAVDRPVSFGQSGLGATDDEQDLSIIAITSSLEEEQYQKTLEIHKLGSDQTRVPPARINLGHDPDLKVGIHSTISPFEQKFSAVSNSLRLVRLKSLGSTEQSPTPASDISDPRTRVSLEHVEKEQALFEPTLSTTEVPPPGWEEQKTKEEIEFATNLANTQTSTIVWVDADIWSLNRNPLSLQLDAKLDRATTPVNEGPQTRSVDARQIVALLAQIRDKEARTEAEFLSLGYIRQKASLLLFLDCIKPLNVDDRESQLRLIENVLMEGGLDPRVILLMVPFLREDVLQGPQGIWIHHGIAQVAESSLTRSTPDLPEDLDLLSMIRRFLASWQGKRGFGSITDEKLVFDSVDAALLHTLLHLDQQLPPGSKASSSVRTKLNNVVDHWKGDFKRAVDLLESYRRLYILSRLYQSRKLAKDVLKTWKRIIEGDIDSSGELTPEAAEVRIRNYLVNIRNASLVEEYGLFLAQRKPSLSIEVFTDGQSRVKFEPAQLTQLLKEHAPLAVQQYLEHLVFKKNQPQYIDDLIGYYLDSMLSVLERSEEARNSLAESYSTYRALSPPKPTYLTFITQNAPQESWWQSRLRLLQLLSGDSSYASSPESSTLLTYSIPTVLARLAPFSNYLASESIILDARQGHHSRAIDSLTHGLGDYDTAIRYCYFGGPPPNSSRLIDPALLPSFETQKKLFNHLFSEFLKIQSAADRLERTSDLLAKFAPWYDPLDVLSAIPLNWPIEHVHDFFTRTLRKLQSEKDESMVLRGLAAAENLRKQVEWVEGCEMLGAFLEETTGNFKGSSDKGNEGMKSDSDLGRNNGLAEVHELLSDDLVVS